MKIYSRLFKYISHYKYRLVGGILLSILVSFFNGASITSLIPIFDSLGQEKNYKFQIALTKKDKELLANTTGEISRLDKFRLVGARWKVKLNEKMGKMKPDELVLFFCMIVFPLYVFKLLAWQEQFIS